MDKKQLTGYPSIDKPWLKYYSEEAVNAKTPQCSIYENIYINNQKYLSDIALMYFGKKITYKELFNNVDKTAKALVSYGVKQGDNVAVCMPAIPEAIYVIFALNKIGANANMLNPTFTEEQLTDRIKETEAELLFVINELFTRIEKVIPKTSINRVISCAAVNSLGAIVKAVKKVKNIKNTISWSEFIKNGREAKVSVPKYQANWPAIMVYSSGTTGASKGIQLTNDSINSLLTQGRYIGFDWKREDRFFCQIPIWFSTGICATVFLPLISGITVVLEPLYNFDLFYRHIVKYRPNFMISAVGLVDFLKEKREFAKAYKNFKYLVIGGEYVVSSAEKNFNKWLEANHAPERLHKGYGMCECGSIITASHQQCNAIGSAGIPLPQIVVAAFDLENGKELQYGKRGEIRVLSECRMLGYYKNPKATKEYFYEDENGRMWACTGDMGYVAEDGSVYVDGRISSSYVNESGETIYLFDIERTVLEIELIRQCKVVVSVINGKKEHIVHLTLREANDIKNSLNIIKEYCASKLTFSQRPRWIKLYDSALPVSPSGKLDVAEMERNITGLIKL
ncbi:MAG: acyl--CoA ligase [Lachnospiraceae bacterium]|nr:acyl--CoA ligase [Lachnospiraceae bacterium]